MRLRICIQRNRLPDVNALWPVPSRQSKNTVAQLVEEVNKIFPLESDTWGLENYAVTIGTYDCLHYHEIGAVFKDEDEVTIRPLKYAELRSRTLLGRDQITSDGRHLLDGLPFGRPLVKGAVRPALTIPPRETKHARVEDEQRKVGEQKNVEHRVKRVKYSLDSPDRLNRSLHDAKTIERNRPQPSVKRTRRPTTDVISPGAVDVNADDSEDSEDDGDFELDEDTSSHESDENSLDEISEQNDGRSESKSESGSESGSESEDMSSSDGTSSSEESSDDNVASTKSSKKSSSDEWNGILTPPSLVSSNVNGTTNKSSSSEPQNKNLPLENVKDRNARKLVGTPQQGLVRTQLRNIRRRESRRLKFLKATGKISQDARIADLPSWQKVKAMNDMVNLDHTTGFSKDISFAKPAEPMNGVGDLERKRQRLLNAILSGGVEVTKHENGIADEDPDAKPDVQSSKATKQMNTTSEDSLTDNLKSSLDTTRVPTAALKDMVPPFLTRRARLDIAGAKRMLFGSLGARVPRNEEEKNRIQDKLAGRTGRNNLPEVLSSKAAIHSGVTKSQPTHAVNGDEDHDSEAWRDHIDLRAVECCEEGITLSEPPFPFYQRWDPQQRQKKKRKRAHMDQSFEDTDGTYMEVYDKYNQDGNGDALNYDDVPEDDYWEEGALLGDEEGQEYDHVEPFNTFPPLPLDVEALAIADEGSAVIGNFILYTELACSAATNWQPTEVTRTALLENKDEQTGEWTVLLAERDMPLREYGEDGKRIYAKFEMQGADEDDDDFDGQAGRRRILKWSELGNPRLLAVSAMLAV